jgi:hypothetical protein
MPAGHQPNPISERDKIGSHLCEHLQDVIARGDVLHLIRVRKAACRLQCWPGQAPERFSGLIRPRLPADPDEHGTVAGVHLPGVVLVEIVLSELLQQSDELLPFASRQAVVHTLHDAGHYDQHAT